jgi:two-component system, chemotaxis family, protein-glutamate methylesterase/glutaminase
MPSEVLTGNRELILEQETRPSNMGGDALLASAAAVLPGPAIGVILSGMLTDGTRGIRAIKRHGGRVLVQDPATARAASMPASALATGCVDFTLPPHRLAPAPVALTMAPAAPACWPCPPPLGRPRNRLT